MRGSCSPATPASFAVEAAGAGGSNDAGEEAPVAKGAGGTDAATGGMGRDGVSRGLLRLTGSPEGTGAAGAGRVGGSTAEEVVAKRADSRRLGGEEAKSDISLWRC